MKWYPVGVDMPVVYWVIAISTTMWGIGTSLSWWLGLWVVMFCYTFRSMWAFEADLINLCNHNFLV